jgi:small nuclear ribonucleoprotein
MSGRPLDVLEASLGDVVTVRLKSGDEYVGELGGYDQHMNVVLDPLDNGAADAAEAEEPGATSVRDTTIIRGDNVISIHP